jgi:DNA-binding HxlR family transcriptional regulator
VRDLAAGPRRFVELQRVLPGISTEQLRSRLNRMVADGLLTRQRYREVPPRVDYELTERARDLMPILGALARWGYDWTWSGPRDGEDVDIGAILRLAPGLMSPPRSLRGSAVFSATGKQGKPREYRLRAKGGRVEIEEPRPETKVDDSEPDARVKGSHGAWVSALGPDGDRSGLKFEGDRRLAEALLDGIAHNGRSNSKAA